MKNDYIMKIRTHKELDVYRLAFDLAMDIYTLTLSFPKDEKYSLVDQVRRSSRSVCANIAEAFRKRRYPKYFVSKLNEVEGEAAETQVWIEFCQRLGYITSEQAESLNLAYDQVIGKVVKMSSNPEAWVP